MSELEELYEKVTKAIKLCNKGGYPYCNEGCPYADERHCIAKKWGDEDELIELQHAEIERLKAERKEQ